MRSILLPLVPVLLLACAVLAATILAARRSGEDLLTGPGGVVAHRVVQATGRWVRTVRRRTASTSPSTSPSTSESQSADQG